VTRHRLLLLGWAVLIGLLTAWSALAGQPTDQLRPEIERVIKTIEDPTLKGDGKGPARRQALRAITESVFDWTEMGRRALGSHWQARSEAERAEFVPLFRDLMERAYVSKIERYSGERITYSGDTVDGDLATVRTRVMMKQGQEVPVDYRMVRREGRWLVYDVTVEGISLVGNYRTQFNEVIRTSSYEELIRKLKSRSS